MATTRQIINDLRAQARAVDASHLQGAPMEPIVRVMRRAADEIERMEDELNLLRAYAEIGTDAE